MRAEIVSTRVGLGTAELAALDCRAEIFEASNTYLLVILELLLVYTRAGGGDELLEKSSGGKRDAAPNFGSITC